MSMLCGSVLLNKDDCPLVRDLLNSTVVSISYSMTITTPRSIARELETRTDKAPAHVLFGHLWAFIRMPDVELHSVKINCENGGVISIMCPPANKGYTCTVNDRPVNSIRGIRDMLVGSKLTAYHMDDSVTTSTIDNLFVYYKRYDKPVFEEMIDGKEVKWENGKWCDEEYLASQ